MMGSPQKNHMRFILGVLIAFLVAVGIRLAFLDEVVGPDRYWVFQDDPPYHLRRALMTLYAWPVTPFYDPFLNYPGGNRIYWPAGLSWLLAASAKLFGAQGPEDRFLVESIATFAPPLVGALTASVTFFIGCRISGLMTGLWSSLIVGFVPVLVENSLPARFDHHIFEPLIVLFIAWCILERSRSDKPRYSGYLWVVLGALTVAFGLWTWPASLLHLGILFAACAMSVVFLSEGGRCIARSGALIFGLALPFSYLVIADTPWAGQYVYFTSSLLHLYCIAVAAVVLYTLSIAGTGRKLVLLLSAILFVTAGLILRPDILASILDGLSYTRGHAFSTFVSESTPMTDRLERSALDGGIFTMIAAGVGVWLVIKKYRYPRNVTRGRAGNVDSDIVLIAVLSILTLIPALLNNRWTPIAVPFAALTMISGINQLVLKAKVRYFLAFALIFAVFAASFSMLRSLTVMSPQLKKVQTFLAEIPNITPEASTQGYSSSTSPSYGVLTPWWLGHLTTYLSGRPTLANNFYGTPFYDQPNIQSISFYTHGDCDELAKTLAKQRIRYALILAQQTQAFELTRAASILGLPKDHFILPTGAYTLNGLKTMVVRIGAYDGSGLLARSNTKQRTSILPACGRFRLVAERRLSGSSTGPGELKLVEVVRGAHIRGYSRTHNFIELRLKVKTSLGRTLHWRSYTYADDSGRYQFVVPYSTEKKCNLANEACEISPSGGYELLIANKPAATIEVSEEEVVNGLTLDVSNQTPDASPRTLLQY